MKELINAVLKKAKKPLSFETICGKVELLLRESDDNFIGLNDNQKEEIAKCLEDGINNYKYIKTPNDNYVLMSKTSFRKGTFYGTKKGDGVVSVITSYVDGSQKKVINEEKYSIPTDRVNGAIDGDTVLVDIGNNIVKPHIVKVIDRNLEYIQGEVYRIGENYFVKSMDKKKQGLLIALEGEAIEGQIVSVKLKQQTSNNAYIGEITDVLGHVNAPGNDILLEAYKCGIDDKFSEASLEQVKTIPDKVLPTDKIGRDDLTAWEIFTIDGADTKDIDDALSCRKLANGNYLVGVHIADVAHYVKKGSPLDKDVFKRGNSYYLGGKVIPMLPPELSNGICSLNPHVERLAKSCIMEVSPEGKVLRYDIKPTVICSNLKMTYDAVNKILKEGMIPEGYEKHADTLKTLNELALILRKKRLEKGATEFDRPELHIDMNDEHEIVGFSMRRCDMAENLIEEFMLLANETVDRHIKDSGYPGIHRVHDIPNYERLVDFYKLLDAVNMPFTKYTPDECLCTPNAMQELAEHIMQNEKLANALSLGLIKCNSRAIYSIEDIGHFGLRKKDYTHFTSPIRRLSDLITHRVLDDIAEDDDLLEYDDVDLMELAAQATKTERVSDTAEDIVLRMKCSEYMSKHIGEEFEGTIISVSDRNIVVQLDNLIEGRILTKSLKGPYIYNPESFTLVSVDGNENYYYGDRLRVRVKSASKEEKTIDFEVVEKIDENFIRDKNSSNKEAVYVYKKREENNAYFN